MAEDEPGREFHGADDPRLHALDERLREVRAREAERTQTVGPDAERGYSQGNRVIAALIGSLAGGALIGWLIDRFAGTTPWGLIVMLFFGIAVAFRQIIRISTERPE